MTDLSGRSLLRTSDVCVEPSGLIVERKNVVPLLIVLEPTALRSGHRVQFIHPLDEVVRVPDERPPCCQIQTDKLGWCGRDGSSLRV